MAKQRVRRKVKKAVIRAVKGETGRLSDKDRQRASSLLRSTGKKIIRRKGETGVLSTGDLKRASRLLKKKSAVKRRRK